MVALVSNYFRRLSALSRTNQKQPDIGRAVALIHRALGLWLVIIVLGEWGYKR